MLLIRYLGGFDTNPRIVDAIADSEEFIRRFVEAIGLDLTCPG